MTLVFVYEVKNFLIAVACFVALICFLIKGMRASVTSPNTGGYEQTASSVCDCCRQALGRSFLIRPGLMLRPLHRDKRDFPIPEGL